jgi:hypothetical protein
MGTWNIAPGASANASFVIGASDAPKSTFRATIWFMPPPDPIGWYVKAEEGSVFA